MKTSTFIERCANGYEGTPRRGTKTVASVMWDGETLYSYGPHYPLLFKVAGQWVCNDRGHSVTTSKHIGQARQYSDFNVELQGSDTSAAAVISSAFAEIKRNDATIAEALERQIKRPRYEHVYQRAIDAAEERTAQLYALINAAGRAK